MRTTVLVLSSILAAIGCTKAAPPSPAPAQAQSPPRPAGKMQLLVTVDWEGREIAPENLAAMGELRRRFPDLKLVHFLNAAYFTKPDADPAAVTAKIASAVMPNDERGLHVHGWKRLFEAAGVTFRSAPTFWGKPLRNDCSADCGHEVEIAAYTVAELRKVVRFSLDKLAANGFEGVQSFRCGGWIARENVREAIVAEGLRFDDSAVPAEFLEAKLKGLPLHDELKELWQATTPTSQPFRIKTAAGDLVEVPDNGALADYVSADQMVATWEANEKEFLRDKTKNVVVSIGFHQETSPKYLANVESALERIYERAKADQVPLENVTTSAIALP